MLPREGIELGTDKWIRERDKLGVFRLGDSYVWKTKEGPVTVSRTAADRIHVICRYPVGEYDQ